jgi:plasmid replication initiation protein
VAIEIDVEDVEIISPGDDLALVPERHPQYDLFVCDVADAVLKDIMPQLEHPFYSLSKKPETTIREYRHNDQWIRVVPSVKGLATIYDKDILIYCISQVMAAMRRGEPVSRRISISIRDLLIFTNRGTSGKDYDALVDALERIKGTVISTNIVTGDEEQTDTFGLIEKSSVRRKHGLDGRIISCEVELSKWVFNAIKSNEVLTLHRDYFRLRKPLERRIYELGRKHCGKQKSWRVSVGMLWKKSGSKSPEKRFRQMVKDVAASNHLPDYEIHYDQKSDMVNYVNRGTMNTATTSAEPWNGPVSPDVYEGIRERAPGWDPYMIEQEWRNWLGELDTNPRNPDAHLLKFATTWFDNRGKPA